ncbi:RNA polymerase sigma-70 factor [Gaoshiqia sediminis]|uniref:RNA polymerase sigma-70 factor n=1 Tax=Gaoshiqia sediminis TaxID=2986998 RepID=A0AA41Y9B4_9BACT|nr:RNA polymerase sigma-70 factor [Gaoshiqia sediminis]MCW0484509.1 RNA polymerase sigma-70 factor [Gaoshiqia sediminis]
MNKSSQCFDSMEKRQYRSFEELFRLYFPRMQRYACYLLRDSDEADDLVQDVFLQLWRDQDLLDRDKNVSSYLFTILRNRCLNVLKKRIVEDRYRLHETSVRADELYHTSFEKEGEFISFDELLYQEVLGLISEMPEKCGIAFRLKWIEGKKIREIAEIMDISVSMVDKHLSRGLTLAKRKLDPALFLLLVIPSVQ